MLRGVAQERGDSNDTEKKSSREQDHGEARSEGPVRKQCLWQGGIFIVTTRKQSVCGHQCRYI